MKFIIILIFGYFTARVMVSVLHLVFETMTGVCYGLSKAMYFTEITMSPWRWHKFIRKHRKHQMKYEQLNFPKLDFKSEEFLTTFDNGVKDKVVCYTILN